MQSSDTIYDPMKAGLGARFFAYMIDLFIWIIIILILRFNFLIFGLYRSEIFTAPILFRFTILDIAAYLAGAFYFVLFTYFSGATLGKMLFRLKVISINSENSEDSDDSGDSSNNQDNRLTFVDVLYRETVGRFLSLILFIGYIYAACNQERLALHDVLCDTKVVYSFNPAYSYNKVSAKPKPVYTADTTNTIDNYNAYGTPYNYSPYADKN